MDIDIRDTLKAAKTVHFIGIGGISMSALAEILFKKGYCVTGSDIAESSLTGKLSEMGIPVVIGHDPKNLGEADMVVYTAAVRQDNVELQEAARRHIPAFERAVLLGTLMEEYAFPICIAGTHGKTTTTSMVSQILLTAGKDPTCLVGGQLSSIGGNIRIGGSGYMVCEACEYVDSFLTLHPKIAVVLNIEEDHLDYYSGLEQIKGSFLEFINLAGPGGWCVYCADNVNAVETVMKSVPKRLSFGIKSASCDIRAADVTKGDNNMPEFELLCRGESYGRISLKVPGVHNVYNALAAAAVAVLLGIGEEDIRRGLEDFTGTKRRFERLGTLNGADVVDDYAHHPTEIEATLTAARSLPYERIVCVFQPHTYSRTLSLFGDFVKALKLADLVVLAKIYPAREKNVYNVSSRELADEIPGSVYFESFDEIVAHVKSVARPGDIILTMGAGNIWQVGKALVGD